MSGLHITDRNLTIILASVIPGVAALILGVVVCYKIQRRRARFFRRGITPIGEEEIQSWKVDKEDEQSDVLEQGQSHQHSNSVSSNKSASIVVYHNTPPSRFSEDQQLHPISPSCISVDSPTTPVVARAPNARPGLTDDTIPGDDAFILQPKRQTRPVKHPPVSGTVRHNRAWSTRSLSRGLSHDYWYRGEPDATPPRRSTETFTRNRSRSMHQASKNSIAYSTPIKPPRASFDDEMFLGGLSPRPPVHKSEIGRAIG
ncbi:uncharacterized protein BBA_04444 [Beauveria bassiana ARSEF 2860]|uniref:Uncharacterized protein n=1 Tax=Beauveria bassiana (strain ARSEF 2860) TaxID=655819 RepID=J4KNY3_BEAB2|nr:uncharacterized protein BBA_04444 [Beauveria bassiana ARSEF 2860]EJP66504.1 hypothetical protein BBA_04444 [Beauveria bassiana ARSEF 2860]